MNASEKQIARQMNKDYNKLYKNSTKDLGAWLVKNEAAIKAYMPEIYDIAFMVLCDHDTKNMTNKMAFDIGTAFLSAKRGA